MVVSDAVQDCPAQLEFQESGQRFQVKREYHGTPRDDTLLTESTEPAAACSEHFWIAAQMGRYVAYQALEVQLKNARLGFRWQSGALKKLGQGDG